MKTKQNILFFLYLSMSLCPVMAQIGINTSTPEGQLDIVSLDNSGLVLPSPTSITDVTNPNGATVVNGTIVYIEDEGCFKMYTDDTWVDMSTCRATWEMTSVMYNGISVINSIGVGYVGNTVPANSTIDIDVSVTVPGEYNVSGTDPTSGLSYSASGKFLTTGTQTITLIPDTTTTLSETVFGTRNITLSGDATNTFVISPRIDYIGIPANETQIVDVTLANGQVWMDRNLGARQPATSTTDILSYGNLYQWGRGSDGHELTVTDGDGVSREGLNGITMTQSTLYYANEKEFVAAGPGTNWLTPTVDDLWRGIGGVNNPCPSGYRVPTATELSDMVTTLSIANRQDAFDSVLAFPWTGYRENDGGSFFQIGSRVWLWSSSAPSNSINATRFQIATSVSQTNSDRGEGFAIRCIKQ